MILENTPLFIFLAALTLLLLTWRIKPARFRAIPWYAFCLAAALFWGTLALALVLTSWSRYYSHFTSANYQYLAPLASIVIYPLWVLGMRWIALRLPLHPVLTFCLLGSLEATFEHTIAIYRLNILETVPMLQGSSPLGIFIFAFFEYIVYWGLVLALATLLDRLFHSLRQRKTEP